MMNHGDVKKHYINKYKNKILENLQVNISFEDFENVETKDSYYRDCYLNDTILLPEVVSFLFSKIAFLHGYPNIWYMDTWNQESISNLRKSYIIKDIDEPNHIDKLLISVVNSLNRCSMDLINPRVVSGYNEYAYGQYVGYTKFLSYQIPGNTYKQYDSNNHLLKVAVGQSSEEYVSIANKAFKEFEDFFQKLKK